MFRIFHIVSVFVIITLILSILSSIASIDAKGIGPVLIEVAPESEDTPDWEVGDQWVMGFEEEINEMDLIKSLPPEERFMLDYIDIDFDVSLGVYESLKVIESGVSLDEYSCYKTNFEAYYALAAGIDAYIDIDEDDFEEIAKQMEALEAESYEEEEIDYDYEEDMTSIYEEVQMTLSGDYKGTAWIDAGLNGEVYFTEDGLAVVKEVMEYRCNANIVYEFSLDMQMKESYMFTNIEMSGRINLQMEDVKLNFIKEYDPPLDIFQYPVLIHDYWNCDTTTSFEITEASGTIIYDVEMISNIDYDENVDEEGTISLTKEMFDDLTYVYSQELYGDAYDTDRVELPDGSNTDCKIIDFDVDSYEYYDWDSDGEVTKEEFKSDYEDSAGQEIFEEFDDPGTYSEIGYVNSFAGGDFYYSEDEAYVVQEDLFGFDGVSIGGGEASFIAMPIGFGLLSLDEEDRIDDEAADLTLTPKEYRELSAFKDTGRGKIKSDFESYRTGYNDQGTSGSTQYSLLYAIIAIIVVIVLVVIAAQIVVRRRKGKGVAQAPILVSPQFVPPATANHYSGIQTGGQPAKTAVSGMQTYPQEQYSPEQHPARVQPYPAQPSPPPQYYPTPPQPQPQPQPQQQHFYQPPSPPYY